MTSTSRSKWEVAIGVIELIVDLTRTILTKLSDLLLQHGDWQQKTARATLMGHILMVAAVATTLLVGVWNFAKVGGFGSLLLSIVFVIVVVAVGQFLADRFIRASAAIMSASPTRLNNVAILDCVGILLAIGGVLLLLGGLANAFSGKGVMEVTQGVVLFSFSPILLFAGWMALVPKTVNVLPTDDASAGEEAIGLMSFAAKVILSLSPLYYLCGGLAAVLVLVEALFYLIGGNARTGGIASSYTMIILPITILLPLVVYVLFLIAYLGIDLIQALLNINRNLQAFCDRS